MITKVSTPGYFNGRACDVTEYRGLSTDEKPMDAINGAVFIEMDTGAVFMFDGAGQVWHAI